MNPTCGILIFLLFNPFQDLFIVPSNRLYRLKSLKNTMKNEKKSAIDLIKKVKN